ncbi:MAG TPA: hypothetical protein VH436_12250, partial [Vicinamibacterales bacterium]
HPAMNEMTQHYNIPLEAVLGGPETMYPEYRKKIKDKYVMPPPVVGRGGGGAPAGAPAGGRGTAPQPAGRGAAPQPTGRGAAPAAPR